LFWDVKSKEIVQRVSGHEGVVIWVDTCPGQSGTLVSGGLDGTVRIWVDVNEDEAAHVNGLRSDHENSATPLDQVYDGSDMAQLKVEKAEYDGDVEEGRMIIDGEETPAQGTKESAVCSGLDEMDR
jgi:COMPASS component SWD3